MKFNVTQTSDLDYREQIEINTLEELLNFCKENGGQIVLTLCPSPSAKVKRTYLPSIEIYDTWRE